MNSKQLDYPRQGHGSSGGLERSGALMIPNPSFPSLLELLGTTWYGVSSYQRGVTAMYPDPSKLPS